MTYTDQQITELIAEARQEASLMRQVLEADGLRTERFENHMRFDRLAEALAQVKAERDELMATLTELEPSSTAGRLQRVENAAEYTKRAHDGLQAENAALRLVTKRVGELIAPFAARIDRERVGTHSPSCHEYHADCLVLAVERALDTEPVDHTGHEFCDPRLGCVEKGDGDALA